MEKGIFFSSRHKEKRKWERNRATESLKGFEIIFHLLLWMRLKSFVASNVYSCYLRVYVCISIFVSWVWKLTWYAADIHKDGRYIGGQIQLSRENMISDYNSATPATLPPICSKLLFYIYCGHVNRTHAVGAMLIIRNWCLRDRIFYFCMQCSRTSLLLPKSWSR